MLRALEWCPFLTSQLKKCQISDASHWLVPNEPTRQKFVQRGLQRAKNSKICCFNIVGDKLLLNFGVKSQICHGNAPYVPEPNWFKVAKCYAWWCQGIKRLFRKPKHTKERTKLDSNRGFCRTVPNLMNLSQSWCSKRFSAWSSQYDKQVKIPRLRVRKFVTYDIRYSNGKLSEYVIIRIRTNHHRLHILISYFKRNMS